MVVSRFFLALFLLPSEETRRPAWSRVIFQHRLHMHTHKKTQQHNKMAVVERSRVLTGICLLIEDCSSIIQPVPRKKVKCESCLHHTDSYWYPERSRSLLWTWLDPVALKEKRKRMSHRHFTPLPVFDFKIKQSAWQSNDWNLRVLIDNSLRMRCVFHDESFLILIVTFFFFTFVCFPPSLSRHFSFNSPRKYFTKYVLSVC